MSALPPLHQRFVELLVDAPLRSNTKCLIGAGYKGNVAAAQKMAWRLMKNPAVTEARHEAAKARLLKMAPLGIEMLERTVRDRKHKDHQKAVDSLLDRAGFQAVQKTESTVTHQYDRNAIIARIATILERHPQSFAALIAPVAVKDGDTVKETMEATEED